MYGLKEVRDDGMSCGYLGKCPRQREQQRQRPGRRGIFDLFAEQEDQRSFSRVRREGESVDEARGPGEQVASAGYSSE